MDAAKAGDQPNPKAARTMIDSLAKLVSNDRTSLMALTAMKRAGADLIATYFEKDAVRILNH